MSDKLGFTRKCPYCGAKVVLKDSVYVYHNHRNYGSMWVCSNFPKCNSYVGCHRGTTIPLGRLANAELRRAKNLAHYYFDALWKSGFMTREQAYIWLATSLGISQGKCHIGMFDTETCGKVVKLCKKQKCPMVESYRAKHSFRGAKKGKMFHRGFHD